jgi:acetyl-CoA carboxylase, biotin carboxylase subunit
MAKERDIPISWGRRDKSTAFARAVASAGIPLVGPEVAGLEAREELRARRIGVEAGLPVVPDGEAADVKPQAVL